MAWQVLSISRSGEGHTPHSWGSGDDMQWIDNQYRVLREIGSGGMGHVYLVSEDGPDGFTKYSAAKVISPELLVYGGNPKDNAMLDRFTAEARIVSELQHPNIVPVHRFFVDKASGQYCILMPYIHGTDLSHLAFELRERLTQRELVYIGVQLYTALRYAHQKIRNLIHRDIKPGNVLISTDGTVFVGDFGIARADTDRRNRRTVLQPHQLPPGTPPYLAPEQLPDPETGLVPIYDQRVDIYAGGVTLWEAATGQTAFHAGSKGETMDRIRAGKLQPARKLNPDLSRKLSGAIDELRHPNREKRTQTADRAIQLLKATCSDWEMGQADLARRVAGIVGESAETAQKIAYATTPAVAPKTAAGRKPKASNTDVLPSEPAPPPAHVDAPPAQAPATNSPANVPVAVVAGPGDRTAPMKLSIDALAASRTASAAKTLLPQQAKAAPVDPDEKVLIDPKAWRPQTALPGMQPADVSAAAGSNGAARAGDTREVASDSADSSSNESAASTPRRKSAGYVPVLLVGGLVASCLGLGAFILMRRPSSVPESRAAVATGGSLTIGKAPSPDVMLFVDDVGVGNPPKTVPVSPGGHRVLLVNRKSGESKKVEINVDPGGSSYVPVE